MSAFDATSPRRTNTDQRREENTQAVPVDLVEELAPPRPHYSNLARGIVWADIVADIAADERARQARGRGDQQLPEAA